MGTLVLSTKQGGRITLTDTRRSGVWLTVDLLEASQSRVHVRFGESPILRVFTWSGTPVAEVTLQVGQYLKVVDRNGSTLGDLFFTRARGGWARVGVRAESWFRVSRSERHEPPSRPRETPEARSRRRRRWSHST